MGADQINITGIGGDMKPHKWEKEIKAWADGAEIQHRLGDCWRDCEKPAWGEQTEYRIKPQPKESEFSHIPYWLCCGSLDIRHHHTSCSEAKAGYPERCRFGTAEEHRKRMEKPTPKEPQYLYAYKVNAKIVELYDELQMAWDGKMLLGKIKLETEDE